MDGKMTDGWEGRDRARGRKIGYTQNVTEGGYKSIELWQQQIGRPECTSNLLFSLSFNTFSWHGFFGYELNTWYSQLAIYSNELFE